jgi:hypothetical protein
MEREREGGERERAIAKERERERERGGEQDFEFFRIFMELIDSLVMNTPGSQLESLRMGSFFKHKSYVPL